MQPNRQPSQKSEARFGTKDGIAVTSAGPNKGRITLFDGDGKGRSPFQYIQHEMGLSSGEAIKWAANWLGVDGGVQFKPDPKLKERRRIEKEQAKVDADGDDAQRRAVVAKLVNDSVPVANTPAEIYLSGRAITSWPEDIRYQPNNGQEFGALIVVARDGDNKIRAVQRVYLTPEGAKADVKIQKRTNGKLGKAAVKMPGCGSRLFLTEGPETGLSVWNATNSPTWSVLGQNFCGREIPDDISEIVIAADCASEGSPARQQAEKAAEHYFGRGYKVFIARPDGPNCYDFNDLLIDQGQAAVLEALNSAVLWGGVPAQYRLSNLSVEAARKGVENAIREWVELVRHHWIYLADTNDSK
ncbi:MAG: hypothetical protein HN725_08110 [Alphaproteobacteria bacterium]|nr:hypothetical protein [Alphaproteobacteria bacterium]